MELHCVRGSVDLEVLGSPRDLANREAGASLGGMLKPMPAWGAFEPVCCALYAVCVRVGGWVWLKGLVVGCCTLCCWGTNAAIYMS